MTDSSGHPPGKVAQAQHTWRSKPVGESPLYYSTLNPLVFGESRRYPEPDGWALLTCGTGLRWDMTPGLDKIHEVAERVARSSGLEVVEVDLRGGGKARMLRIFIDKPGGVTHEDCANFSREAGTIFDVEDAVPGGTYTLEVSSPGLDRKLSKPAEFERFNGSLVKLMTRDPIEGNRHFEGRMRWLGQDRIGLELSGRKKSKKLEGVEAGTKIEIELANVEKANLVPEF